jgi:hypothetical protein
MIFLFLAIFSVANAVSVDYCSMLGTAPETYSYTELAGACASNVGCTRLFLPTSSLDSARLIRLLAPSSTQSAILDDRYAVLRELFCTNRSLEGLVDVLNVIKLNDLAAQGRDQPLCPTDYSVYVDPNTGTAACKCLADRPCTAASTSDGMPSGWVAVVVLLFGLILIATLSDVATAVHMFDVVKFLPRAGDQTARYAYAEVRAKT